MIIISIVFFKNIAYKKGEAIISHANYNFNDWGIGDPYMNYENINIELPL